MADALITYEIVIGSFFFLTGLLFTIRHKYYKTRPTKNFASSKANIDWMK